MRNEVALGVNRLLDHGRSSTSTSSERSWRACVMRWTSLGGVLLAIRMAPSDQKRVCAV
jgi:hypothetical protein